MSSFRNRRPPSIGPFLPDLCKDTSSSYPECIVSSVFGPLDSDQKMMIHETLYTEVEVSARHYPLTRKTEPGVVFIIPKVPSCEEVTRLDGIRSVL